MTGTIQGLNGHRLSAVLLMAGFVAAGTVSAAAAEPAAARTAKPTAADSSSHDWHNRQSLYYKRNWGLDIVGVHPIASGYMLEFRYRILDAEKAKTLNDERAKAYLIDEATGTRLAVPNMENIGELRQKATPQGYRTYFIIFGNPGKLVKPGGRVTVVVGDFRADGLVVD